MIAVDTNILVYAHRQDSRFHKRAAELVRALAEGQRSWAIPWPCVHEFLAVVTHPRIYDPPTPASQAIAQVEAWLGSPSLTLISEDSDYWSQLKAALDTGVTGPKIHDARVAALCSAAGVTELWSADRDFSRFPLRTTNPLLD
ncbi:MAG: PIN domain-containing protein [bacterium]|nr:PIN domain-containing protein [bacterium]